MFSQTLLGSILALSLWDGCKTESFLWDPSKTMFFKETSCLLPGWWSCFDFAILWWLFFELFLETTEACLIFYNLLDVFIIFPSIIAFIDGFLSSLRFYLFYICSFFSFSLFNWFLAVLYSLKIRINLIILINLVDFAPILDTRETLASFTTLEAD